MAENTSNVIYPCVGYGFVPYQTMDKTYLPKDALSVGTVFPELNLTIDEYGKSCKQEGEV